MPTSLMGQSHCLAQPVLPRNGQEPVQGQSGMVSLPEQVHYGPYRVQVAGPEHLCTTLALLRPEDAAEVHYVEILAGGQRTAQQLVYESFHSSAVRYALLRGQRILGVGGLCPLPQNLLVEHSLPGGVQAWWVPWMVGTASLNRFPGGFGAIATFFRQEVQPRFSYLCNMVAWPDQHNRMLLPAWLAGMGFTVQTLPAAKNHAQGWCTAIFYCLPTTEGIL